MLRFFETLGEDPVLTSGMGRRIITGYQGTSLSDAYSTLYCLKHFVGYSFPLSGRARTPASIKRISFSTDSTKYSFFWLIEASHYVC